VTILHPALFVAKIPCDVIQPLLLLLLLQVDDAYDALLAVIEDLLFTLKTAAAKTRPAGKPPSADQLLYADDNNVAVWIKLPTKELRALASKPLRILSAHPQPQQQQQREQHLRAPYDRNGSVHKKQDLRTCDELDAALNAYRSECGGLKTATVVSCIAVLLLFNHSFVGSRLHAARM
jgi:hypothetical protein